MATHQSVLTSILDFFPLSEVATIQQTDGAAHKLKSRLFHKFAHLWVHFTDSHPSVNHAWQYYQTPKFAVTSKQFCLLNPQSQFCLQCISPRTSKIQIVIATTRWNGTCSMLTSAKLSVGYLVVGITRELDKEPLLYCSSIYINTRWSMLQ